MKRWITLVAMALVLLGSVPVTTRAEGNVPRIHVGGVTFTTSLSLTERGEIPLVSFNDVANALDLVWEEQDGTITASRWGTKLVLQIDEPTAKINKREWKLDVPPTRHGETTMVPLQLFAQAFGVDVSWNTATRTAHLSTQRQVHMLAFYASGSYSSRFDLNFFDDVAMAWSQVDREGRFRRNSTGWFHVWPKNGAENRLVEFKQMGRPRYLNIYAEEVYWDGAVDSWYLEKIMADPVRREQLVDEIVDDVTELDFEGILLDFEGMGGYPPREPVKEAIEGYIAFVEALVARLSPLDKKVGVALQPPEGFQGYDHNALAHHADFIVLMAHDFQKDDWSDPEPLDRVEKAIRDMLALKVPAEKMLLATVAYYETPETLVEKAVLAKRYNLRGISLWHLGELSASQLLSLYGVIRPLR